MICRYCFIAVLCFVIAVCIFHILFGLSFLFSSVLSKLQSLLALNENLKRQEEEYKAQCKVWRHFYDQILLLNFDFFAL